MLSLQFSQAQKQLINVIDSGRKTSLRGLSVVDDNVVWASGSNGTVARSVDGGKTFEWLTVAGYEKRDFRDIEAFDKNTAIIMGISEPAIILKTKDGGKSWYKVFEDSTKGMFLDAMDFDDHNNGIVIGDPINDRLFIAFTSDNGEHWNSRDKILVMPAVTAGEACFASSGTNVVFSKEHSYYIVTGGKESRLIDGSGKQLLPVTQGGESTGANSIASFDGKTYVIVGGDFANDKNNDSNCVIISSNYKMKIPQTPPHGYRSCVEYITKGKLVTCGTSGVDISQDGGMNWELISTQSFHVCQKAKKGNKVLLAGSNGKIAMLNQP